MVTYAQEYIDETIEILRKLDSHAVEKMADLIVTIRRE